MSDIQPDMKVRYTADPSAAGWVISIMGENARVFIGGTDKLVPLRELEPAAALTELPPDEFRIALTRRRLEHPVTDQLLSFKASKTRLLYHQFLPVKKMLESPDQRLLIADEVGTGKTIEAGLIWAELESRAAHGLENVWVVCPKSLVGKWRDEMLQRFDLRLETLSPEGLRQALVQLERDGVLSPRFARCVVNLELLRLEAYAQRLEQSSIAWDLAVFDEAHHLRNTDTLSHALANFICERSQAAVFLTATPLQTSLQDIVHLMTALGVDVAEDPDLLEEQMHWDMRLNDWIRLVKRQPPDWQRDTDRSMRELAASGGRERPGWDAFQQLVAQSDLDDRSQRMIVIDAARDLQALDPYMTRTLRADVDEDRPTREAITRIVQFSDAEKAFYDEVYAISLARAAAEGVPPGFVTQMPERRTASCVPAVASEILRYVTEDEDDEHQARFTRTELSALAPLAQAALDSQDRKLAALCEILEHAFGELRADRVMIFSTFRGTLHYLRQQLQERGYSLDLMYGPTPARDEDCRRGQRSRERIAAEFRQGEFQILLASEVAGEGLDFEHCHVVINYDLPWNPMRVEQRIGRCDRLGQTSDKVYVGNLASVGTIEARILLRLYERLRVFERALGELEVVLGDVIASFERDLFRRGLTQRQQDDRLEQAAQAIENNERYRQSITQSSVISDQGRQLIDSEQQDIKAAEAGFLSPQELAEFVYASIERHLPDSMQRGSVPEEFEVIGGSALQNALRGLLTAYPATHYARTETNRFRNRVAQPENTIVSFLDEGEGTEFVHLRHPLVLLARHLEKEPPSDTPWCSGVVPSDKLDRPMMLVWAVGSLQGYANRAELLCTAVDCATETIDPMPVNRAQELVRSMSLPTSAQVNVGLDIEALKARAEQSLLEQFERTATAFRSRNELLTDKARRAVRSHAERQLSRNNRQLARPDLNVSLRSLYTGWNRRVRETMQSKLEEIERKGGVISSLEIIGMSVLYPDSLGSRPLR